MRNIEIQEVKLSYKQKLILDVLLDEFAGSGFGPQLLEESENTDIKKLSINEITWHILRLREMGLLSSNKSIYRGKTLNHYKITPFLIYDAVKIK